MLVISVTPRDLLNNHWEWHQTMHSWSAWNINTLLWKASLQQANLIIVDRNININPFELFQLNHETSWYERSHSTSSLFADFQCKHIACLNNFVNLFWTTRPPDSKSVEKLHFAVHHFASVQCAVIATFGMVQLYYFLHPLKKSVYFRMSLFSALFTTFLTPTPDV